MDFYELADRVIALLRQRGRLTYRALKRQFHLDDDSLEDLKAELIKGQQLAVDEEGEVLVWSGAPLSVFPAPAVPASLLPTAWQPDVRHEAGMRLYTVLPAVIALLQRDKRLSYRALTQIFAVDEACLHDVREELHFRQLAHDEDGKGLVWTGETAPQVASSTPQRTVPEADVSASPVPLGPPQGATEMRTPPAGLERPS